LLCYIKKNSLQKKKL